MLSEIMHFPSFGGYSPIVPAPINTVILSLFQEAMDRGRPREGPARGSLELRRESALDVLHHHFAWSTHARAVALLADAWTSHGAFALYLRNFGFGASRLDPIPGPELSRSDSGPSRSVKTVIIDTHGPLVDLRFQAALVARIAPILPVVGVENPALDNRVKDGLPRLTMADDSWANLVDTLVRAASAIVFFVDRVTPGVDQELGIVRRWQRQDATIVVTPGPALASELKESRRIKRDGVRWTVRQDSDDDATPLALDDFPIMVQWDGSPEGIDAVKAGLDRIAPQQERLAFSATPPAPAVPPAPDHIRREAEFVLDAGLTLAGQAFRDREFADAGDKLAVCLAMAFWSDIPQARALCFLWLGRIALAEGQGERAAANIERALDTYEGLPQHGPAPWTDLLPELRERTTALVDAERARALLTRLEKSSGSAPSR